MKFLKSHFSYSKYQRNGIFVLIVLVFSMQAMVYFYKFSPSPLFLKDSVQVYTASLQKQLDSLASLKSVKNNQLKPFNPNYLSDYKAYQLGISVKEIDRLLQYRKQNKYIHSALDFKKVTQISDSLLQILSPYFKFPEWAKQKNTAIKPKSDLNIKVLDINTATVKQLTQIHGIGIARANTILAYKKKIQAYTYTYQLDEVWGLPKEVLPKLKQRFQVLAKPTIQKLNINTASAYQLHSLPYLTYAQAKSIVLYRKEVAEIQKLEEIKTISGFPVEKFHLISLYLQVD